MKRIGVAFGGGVAFGVPMLAVFGVAAGLFTTGVLVGYFLTEG